MQKSQPRELKALDPEEVSLVDKPANKRRFLIIKRENGTMGIFQPEANETKTPAAASGATDPEPQTVDIEKSDALDGLAADLNIALPILRKALDGIEGDEQKAADSALSFLGNVAKGKIPPQFLSSNKKTDSEKTTKNEDGMTEATSETPSTPAVEVKPDGTILINSTEVGVHKAAKQFTAERIETLKTTLGSIAGMLMETGGIEAVKAALAKGLPGDLPMDVMVDSGVRPTATTGVKKSDEPEVTAPNTPAPAAAAPVETPAPASASASTDAITAAITKAMEPLVGRIEAIEKARAPSAADEGEGVTTPVQKDASGMWSGLV